MNAKTQTKPAAPAPSTTTAPVQAPAPAATTTAAPAQALATNPLLAQIFTLAGAKAYNVRPNTAQDNARSWQAIQDCIKQNGGQATRAQLLEAVKPFNHGPMVGYCIRRAWVVEVPKVVAPAPSTAAPAKQ